jgi:uncharacterized repeat protein (TIGR01451 family)
MITKTHSGPFTPDQGGTFTFSIANIGTLSTTGPIVVTDPMPTGLRVVSAAGTGWDCSATTPFTVNCTNPGPLAPFAPALTITVQVSVLLGGPSTIRNTATVSTDGDSNPSNNSDSDVLGVDRSQLAPVASPAGFAAGVLALIGVAAWGLRRIRHSPR